MDVEEIARLVNDLRVSADVRNKGVEITNEEVEWGQKRLEKVVVGKIFSRKVSNRETQRLNLPKILRTRGSTEIEVVGNNLFVIRFALDSDRRVALEEGPWHFFQDLMILKQTKAMQTPMEVEFENITLWVQCHNVPIECMTPSIIQRIGEQVGKVEEVDVGEGGLCVGKYARVRVTRPIDEPLVRCVPLTQKELKKEVIVVLQYEKLPEFCFLCGRVGHISRDCMAEDADRQNPCYDSWLRAGRSFIGRRSSEPGNRNFARTSNSGDSGNKRETGSFRGREAVQGKEMVVADQGRAIGEVGVGNGLSAEKDGNSSEGSRDICMEETVEVISRASRQEEEQGGRVLGTGKRQENGAEERSVMEGSGKGKGKKDSSPRKAQQRSGKPGGKSWKRLARERKVGASQSESSGGNDSKRRGSLKRRGVEEEGGEEEGVRHKQKQLKVRDEHTSSFQTAEAARQPRRTL